jgi:hypothetical protein
VAGADARFLAAGDAVRELGRTPSGWLALLRYHQGRSEETLELTQENGLEATGLDQVALPLGLMSRGLSLAALGRPAEALGCFTEMDKWVERLGIRRYAGRADNCRGHVLRNLGLVERADECNQAGLEAAAQIGIEEAMAHALLDLAESRLRIGDLDAVPGLLAEAAVYSGGEGHGGFQWRQRLRAHWLAGRLALAAGDLDGAGAFAADVREEARLRQAPRYDAFGRLLTLQVRIAEGVPPPPEHALSAVAALRTTAGMEQLWLAIDLASLARGRLREALRATATEVGARLVRSSPVDLQDGVRAHLAALLE